MPHLAENNLRVCFFFFVFFSFLKGNISCMTKFRALYFLKRITNLLNLLSEDCYRNLCTL